MSDIKVENLEEISQEEKFLVESLISKVEADFHDNPVDPDLVKNLDEISDTQIKLCKRIDSLRRNNAKSSIEKLVALEPLIRKEAETDESFESVFQKFVLRVEDLLEELDREDISTDGMIHENPNEKLSNIANKIEKLHRAMKEDLNSLNKETKIEAKKDAEKRINKAIEELNSRPSFYLNVDVYEKIRKKSAQAINNSRETGGFLHYRKCDNEFILNSFFHEPNELNEIDLTKINSIDELREIYHRYIGISPEEFDKKIEKGYTVGEMMQKLREHKNTSYKTSDDVLKMMMKNYSEENIITWHVHPPSEKDSIEKTASYQVSDSDMNTHERFKDKISGFYYEIIAHKYEARENPDSMFLIPNRWPKKDESTIQMLPIWLKKGGNILSKNEIRKNYPLLMKYNKALTRAVAAGVEKRWPYYLDDDLERVSDRLNKGNRQKGYYMQTKTIISLFQSLDVKIENII